MRSISSLARIFILSFPFTSIIIKKLIVIDSHHVAKFLRKSLPLFIAFLFFQTLYSQENYLSGYIINIQGDTIKGIIDYQDWTNNPTKVKLKHIKEKNPIVYTPNDIVEFSVGDKIYVSGIITTETSKNQINELKKDSTLYFNVDTAFLQSIFRGKKSLFYYKNSIGIENFYIYENGAFELLKYKKYLRTQGNELVLAENKKYINQLAHYLIDCPAIQSELVKTQYSLTSLEKLFQHYYNYTSTGTTYYKKKQSKLSTEFGIMGGVALTTIDFQGDNYYLNYLLETKYNKTTNFSGGAFLDIILPGNLGKWSILNELQYSSYLINGSFHENSNFYPSDKTTITKIGAQNIKLNSLVRFHYLLGDFKVFINGGASIGLALSETNYKKVDWYYFGDHYIFEDLAFETKKSELSFIVGSGLKYKKYSFELRYERGDGMCTASDVKSISNRFYALLGYRF